MLVTKRFAVHPSSGLPRVGRKYEDAQRWFAMESGLRIIGIVLATLRAALAASVAGAISFTALFTVANLDVPGIIENAAVMFVVSLAFSFIITVPTSCVAVACTYPFLARFRAAGRGAFGVFGFLVGALVWAGAWWDSVPLDNLYFGSWLLSLMVGGFAGGIGALTFARYLT